MSSLRRRLETSRTLATLLGALLWVYLWVCLRTTRWQTEGRSALLQDLERGPIQFMLWHSRSAMAPALWPGDRGALVTLQAGSPMGRVSAAAQRFFGMRSLAARRGETPAAVQRALLQAMKDGRTLAMVCDGPKGPAGKVNAATLDWARRLQRPVWTFAFATSRGRPLRTWDRQWLPLPFGRGVAVYARLNEVHPGRGAEDAGFVAALEAQLNATTARADALLKAAVEG